MMRVRGIFAGLCFALAACGHQAPKPALGPPPVLPEPKRVVRTRTPPDWFWEAIEPQLRADRKDRKLDLPASDVVRTEGAARVWDELGPEGQERLRRDGLVVVGKRELARAKMGAFYTELREQRIPYVITLDALFYAVHVAHERALAELEDGVMVPALDALLSGLGARLATAEKGADTEIAEALHVARGIVGVAASLDGLAPPDDLAAVVAAEVAAVNAHAGLRPSALLGVPIDYARFAVPSGAAHPSAYKALAWLATAPLALVARSEAPGAIGSVAAARTNTRAAMILAHLVDHEGGDPKLHELHARIAKLLAFVWGPPDDLSPSELADIAEGAKVDLAKQDDVADVVKVDRVRKRATQHRVPRLFDGAGVPGRAGTSVRLFGGHAPADSALLAGLAAPSVASRSLPTSLDLAAWLGGPEARSCLHDEGKDGAAGYDDALARAIGERPDDTIHASVHGSVLDAIAAWLGARGASAPAERASIESALAAWTWLRHDGRALARGNPTSPGPKELRVPGGALPAFVEAAPVVVARLLAAVRQAERGLGVLGPMSPRSPGMASLAEVEDLLATALRIATREANDEPLAPEDVAALASMPARLARLEGDGDAQVPVAADLYTDLRSGRALTSATGLVERALVLVREPGTTARLHLVAGAHVAHHEIVDRIGERTTDAALRARLDAGLSRASYVQAFLLAP